MAKWAINVEWPERVTAVPTMEVVSHNEWPKRHALLDLTNSVRSAMDREGVRLWIYPTHKGPVAVFLGNWLNDRCRASLAAGGSRRAFWREGPFERL